MEKATPLKLRKALQCLFMVEREENYRVQLKHIWFKCIVQASNILDRFWIAYNVSIISLYKTIKRTDLSIDIVQHGEYVMKSKSVSQFISKMELFKELSLVEYYFSNDDFYYLGSIIKFNSKREYLSKLNLVFVNALIHIINALKNALI